MICLTKDEFEQMYKKAKQPELLRVIAEKGYTLENLGNDREKMKEVASEVAASLKSKEEIEIFIALFCLPEFYSKNSKICFVAKSDFNPNASAPASLEELIGLLKENELTDFAVLSDGDLRQFQLKQYRETLNTEALFEFIKKKVEHYAKNLGYVNLLIILQSPEGSLDGVSFEDLTEKIKELEIKSEGEILISYNEENQNSVIVRIYPELGICRVPINWRSQE